MNAKDPIEEALRGMRPAELPPQLMARLTAARPQPRERSAWQSVLLRWLLPLTASACVAVATFFWLEKNRPSAVATAVPESRALPIESEDYLVGARPVGILVAPNQRPYRLMEVEWLEHETVRAGAGGAALHTATTRRDVIPVALELY